MEKIHGSQGEIKIWRNQMYHVKSGKLQVEHEREDTKRDRSTVGEWIEPRLTTACSSLPLDFC